MLNPLLLTGWLLFALIIGLASFNLRKKLSMLPLGRAHLWLLAHVLGGLLAVVLFWAHTRTFWPEGHYEQVLAALFYGVSLNGVVGYILQRIYPVRLTQTGLEIIYERIPAKTASLREEAENVIVHCTQETGSDTLARHYLQTLEWFFRAPRFFASHALGGRKAEHWVEQQCETVRRYLDAGESVYLEKLRALAQIKSKVDLHYTAQAIMKGWLLVHVPLAVMVMMLVLWHVVLVHVYLI